MKRKKKVSFIGPIFFCLPAIIALLICAVSYAGTGLTVSPAQTNLGTIDEGKPAAATFIVENTGTSEVVIQGVKTN